MRSRCTATGCRCATGSMWRTSPAGSATPSPTARPARPTTWAARTSARTSTSSAASSRSPAATRRSSSTSPTARATTAATPWAGRRSAPSAGRRRCASRRVSSARRPGTATTPGGGSRSARVSTARTTSATTAGRWDSRRAGRRARASRPRRYLHSAPMVPQRAAVPRGRHAPPLEVRLGVQRTRLFEAAAAAFARAGYADASAESIAREAGMSKATFYEHFANKEECILALFDWASAMVLRAMAEAAAAAGDDPGARLQAGINAFLEQVATHPDESQTLLVEIIGAGPRAAERRDAILVAFADTLYAEGERAREPVVERLITGLINRP